MNPRPPRRPPPKLRKQYVNRHYPHVILRFEDGHEIHVKNGVGKSFDVYRGEKVKLLAVWDPSSGSRELIDTVGADDFDDAGDSGADHAGGEEEKKAD